VPATVPAGSWSSRIRGVSGSTAVTAILLLVAAVLIALRFGRR
jgi:hypothetical protein